MGDQHGHYETVGDVQEWVWDPGHEPKVGVAEGEFDPTSAPYPDPSPGEITRPPEPDDRPKAAGKAAKK